MKPPTGGSGLVAALVLVCVFWVGVDGMPMRNAREYNKRAVYLSKLMIVEASSTGQDITYRSSSRQ